MSTKRVGYACLAFLCLSLSALLVLPNDEGSSGQLLQGLVKPVRIVRDAEGTPHIFAENDRDVFFGLGYIHAQDRLFQMDVSRRMAGGTLAELFGSSVLDSDIQFRTLGIRRAAVKSMEALSPQTLEVLEAYTKGVNAYIASPGTALPPEYEVLEITSFKPWTALDSVLVAKGAAYSLSLDVDDLTRTTVLRAYLDAGQENGFDGSALFFEDLFRSAPFDPSVSIPGELLATLSNAQLARQRGTTSAEMMDSLNPLTLDLAERYLRKIERIPFFSSWIQRSESARGSNFWLVGRDLSATGNALIANDPHLALDFPSTFHEAHLVVAFDPARGPLDVFGVSFPGEPGLAHGCNQKICWGSTVNPMDVTDLYEEKLAVNLFPLGLRGTFFEGNLEPVVEIPQVFLVNDPDSGVPDDLTQAEVGQLEGGITYLVPRRNQGPIITLDASNPFSPIGISVQYAGFGATRELDTFLQVCRAENLADFKEALQFFDFGSQNWAYADVEGNIAYFTSGELPLREDLEAGQVDGLQPWFLRDGSHTRMNEWLPVSEREPGQALDYAILPFDEMPQVVNPPTGYIANANNDPIGTSLDNDVLNERRSNGGVLYLNPGFTSVRIGRIDEILREKSSSEQKIDLEQMRAIQADNVLLDAKVLAPYILAAFDGVDSSSDQALGELAEDAAVVEAVERLRQWDFTTPTGIREGYDPGDDPENLPEPSESEVQNSVAATIYSVWRGQILAGTIDAALERVGLNDHRPDSERSLSALRHLLEQFDQAQGVGASGLNFFDAGLSVTPEVARDILILRSLKSGLDLLSSDAFAAAFGGSTEQLDYRWGKLHRIVFNHSLGGDFNVPAAGGWEHLSEQLQGVGRSGGYETVDASGHSARADSDRRFMFGGGPARRFVAEMNPSGIEAYQIIPGGYGGDSAAAAGTVQLGRWLTNRYRRIPLQLSEIEAQQTAEFTLVPDSYGLQFPFFQGDSQFFTAIAVVNRVASNLEMEFTAWSPSGSLLEFPENPRLVELPPGRQWARLGGEIFGIAPTDPQSGWIELKLTSSDGEPPSVGSFTQFGDFELRQLDGATAVQSASRLLYFPRVFEGPAAVLGQASGTWISVANPGVGPVQMTIEFVPLESTGSSSRERLAVDRELNSKGVLFERLSELFDVAELPLGYLRVVVTEGEGVVGFELIRLLESGTLIGVNGLPSGATRKLYSAQMAIAETVFTNVSLINTSEFDRTVGLRFLPQGGGGALEASPLQLSPGQSVQFDPSALLPIDSVPQSGSSPSSVPLVGSLEIRIDGPGVIGDVLFGDPDTLKFGAALPLQSQPFQEAIFGHVANLGQFFTGVALFNPNAETAEVKLEVFSSEGELKGTKNLSLAAGDRLSQVLTELVSESANQAGGYIRVTSDRGIIGQELFGTMDLRLQSAVPPTVEK